MSTTKPKTSINEKGQTVALDDNGSWRVYDRIDDKWGQFAKGPPSVVPGPAPAGVEPVILVPPAAVVTPVTPVSAAPASPPAPPPEPPTAAVPPPVHPVRPPFYTRASVQAGAFVLMIAVLAFVVPWQMVGSMLGNLAPPATVTVGEAPATAKTDLDKVVVDVASVKNRLQAVEGLATQNNQAIAALTTETGKLGTGIGQLTDAMGKLTASVAMLATKEATLAEPPPASAEDDPGKAFQFSKWESYGGSERLGILQQKCGSDWAVPAGAPAGRVAARLAKVSKETGKQILRTCNLDLLWGRPATPAVPARMVGTDKCQGDWIEGLGCFGAVLSVRRGR